MTLVSNCLQLLFKDGFMFKCTRTLSRGAQNNELLLTPITLFQPKAHFFRLFSSSISRNSFFSPSHFSFSFFLHPISLKFSFSPSYYSASASNNADPNLPSREPIRKRITKLFLLAIIAGYFLWSFQCKHSTLVECCLDRLIHTETSDKRIVMERDEKEGKGFLCLIGGEEIPERGEERPDTYIGWPHIQLSQLANEKFSELIEEKVFSLKMFGDDVSIGKSRFDLFSKALVLGEGGVDGAFMKESETVGASFQERMSRIADSFSSIFGQSPRVSIGSFSLKCGNDFIRIFMDIICHFFTFSN